ncbi:Aste57867_1981 [Aphanomyces stellatus]|uniref:Aste57867_1981 protein n=1 Tax=Aphanomyces stellatus TaxID=120398 RepID=A0A485KC36_9STRA|nr:hypothetical protein As57867_001979 [Aphanomyces stellatus]VFT79186.1 Aste57867_1981 [Aphanomyces stellatus]
MALVEGTNAAPTKTIQGRGSTNEFYTGAMDRATASCSPLPPELPKKTGRKTIDVGGRILTMSLLKEIDKQEARQDAAARKKQLQEKRAKRKIKPKPVPRRMQKASVYWPPRFCKAGPRKQK